jgi:hypothetical protein
MLIALVMRCAASGAETNAPSGDWLGKLDVNGVSLRLLFKIRKESGSDYVGTMDSLDQGAKDILIDKISFQDKELRFQSKLIKAIFEGTYEPAADRFVGKWIQGSKPLPLTLVRADAARAAVDPIPAKDLAASKRAGEKLSGKWNGILKSSGQEFRLGLNIFTNHDGTATGTLDSEDQGLSGIPLSGIVYKDGNVHFDVLGMTAGYDGVSFNNSSTVTGQWKQAGQVLPLKFMKSRSEPAAAPASR